MIGRITSLYGWASRQVQAAEAPKAAPSVDEPPAARDTSPDLPVVRPPLPAPPTRQLADEFDPKVACCGGVHFNETCDWCNAMSDTITLVRYIEKQVAEARDEQAQLRALLEQAKRPDRRRLPTVRR